MIFAQEPDLSQIHVLKDCGNHVMSHELVPIVTKGDSILPEVLDNLPPPPPAVAMHIQHPIMHHKQMQPIHSHMSGQQQQPQQQQMQQQTSPLQSKTLITSMPPQTSSTPSSSMTMTLSPVSCVVAMQTGVYTLAEEPELEAEENTNM